MGTPAHHAFLAEVARVWSEAVNQTAEVPIPGAPIEEYLRDHLDSLIEALKQEPFYPEPARDVGAKLVARGFTGEHSLGRTVEIVGQILLNHPALRPVEELANKVVSLLGTLTAGYSTALRRRTVAERGAWFREVFESTPVGMVISRLDGTVTETNGAFTEILHYPPLEVAGRNISELFQPADAAQLVGTYRSLIDGRRGRFEGRVTAVTGRGDTTGVALTVSVLRDVLGNPTHHVTMVQDVTDWQLLEHRVRHQSLHDLLTGLPNRLHFAIRLEALLERDRDSAVMLCKIDLDCFGIVNDGLGIGIGDLLLRSVAARLQSLVTEEDALVARFDADEFAILIKESLTTPNAATLAARINAELSEPVYLGERGLAVSACIGIARRTHGETDPKELIRAAEATLHRAKLNGRGQWYLHDPTVDAEERARYRLAIAMPEAWENGQISLCYQPLVRFDRTAADADWIVALATLLRWDHPERGAVAHEDCLALAEQTGLVLSIGPWMLQQSCEQLRGWRERCGAGVPPVRVDLTSYLTQDPDLVAVVRDALEAAQLRPEDVQLGMPVEVIVAGRGDAVDNVGTLADIGVGTVLTRYGQAVGNLVLLESLPVPAVELAGSLVPTIAQQPDSVLRSALAGLVPLIRRTGAAVMVTGIDDAEQAKWWGEVGADSARGAAFAPPMDPQDIPGLLR